MRIRSWPLCAVWLVVACQSGASPLVAPSALSVCDPRLWAHVYKPQRLIVKEPCLTVTGILVDATAHQSRHQADGMRHEADGDSHGWLRVDWEFRSLLNAGNMSDEEGNLVFEIVCRYSVTQEDAKAACKGFHDAQVVPPVGTHVAVTGVLVQDTHHAKWAEVHPVSSIVPIR